ncbi:MAG: LON peptidase substrate-binding domain-containing protein [Pseudomonadota bacterium]
MTEVALYPRPEMVAFPNMVQPLHVFEPRYRQMVNECIRDDRPLGLSHSRKLLRAVSDEQTPDEMWQSNQSTYLPFDVFCMGRCEIVNTTDDGRVHVMVHVEERVQTVSEVQVLPYRIVETRPYGDEPDDEMEQRRLLEEVNEKLIDVFGALRPRLAKTFLSHEWLDLSPFEASFKIFSHLRFEGDLMQAVLESRRTSERLKMIFDVLDQFDAERQ